MLHYGQEQITEKMSSTVTYHNEASNTTLNAILTMTTSTTFGSNNNHTPQIINCQSEPTEDRLSRAIFNTCVCLLYGAVFVIAFIGNGLVCFVVHTTPRMKTVTNYFIVNLAVGDILMTLFCVPFSSLSTLVLQYWPFGAVMCKIVTYSQAVSVLVSAYTLLAISIDRYTIIMRPLKPRVEKGAAKLVVAAVWLGALATAAPIIVVSNVQRPSDWHVKCNKDVCSEHWSSPEQSKQYSYALLALQFALPLSALVYTYARIAHVVWGGRTPGEAHCVRDSRMAYSKRKMVKMMVTVVVVFTICWLPLNTLLVLWDVYKEEWSLWPGMPYVWFASHWVAMSHCCYNPIIYCYMNARYRRGFQQVLAGLLCSRNLNSGRFFHRSSVCEGIPLSGNMAVNGTMVNRRSVLNCRCRLRGTDETGSCNYCASLKQLKFTTPDPPADRTMSLRQPAHKRKE